ncbi:Sodium:sulfate symporter transmembrane region [Musa troglodytarum]|uniref:Sodium:sulfate symporter transmembrane region n=1 Tax=Musa troglodytarum TaxID=320322 RepID=A0A9E7IIL2_9LILI|nr:Sodium:sulfate symporter transmembrane region [Musa troglodytarum]
MESSALSRPITSPLSIRSTRILRHRPVSALLSTPLPSAAALSFIVRPLSPNPLRLHPVKRRHSPIRASSSPSSAALNPAASPSASPQPTQGAKPVPFAISVAIGLAVRFLVPRPVEVTPQAWQLLSIFLSTIAGLVLSPLPVGAWAFIGLTASIITKTLTFSAAFGAFTNEVIWLIVISFFFARGFVKTGLGDRIATYFVKWLGRSTLGLSYGLTISEAFIAPAMPSTTARAGGVFVPIIKSLSLQSGSKPGDQSAGKLGSYLIMSQLQYNDSPGFSGAYSQLDTPDAPALATKKLEQMGPVTTNEWAMVVTMVLAVSLWVFGDALGIPSVVAAMLGLSILLLLGVLNWDDCLSEKSAWDTLAWFAVLVGMAGQLTNLGIVTWMSNCVAKLLQSFSLSWPAALCVLQASYFLIHYLFASQTGHVGALYSAFLAMHLAAGVPGVLAALALAYNTNLFGALTHYSSGQAAVYYGAGYVELPDIFRLGFIVALINALMWGVAFKGDCAESLQKITKEPTRLGAPPIGSTKRSSVLMTTKAAIEAVIPSHGTRIGSRRCHHNCGQKPGQRWPSPVVSPINIQKSSCLEVCVCLGGDRCFVSPFQRSACSTPSHLASSKPVSSMKGWGVEEEVLGPRALHQALGGEQYKKLPEND